MQLDPPPRHRGRFAPSPTGPLHFGSLVAAAASYADARAAGGQWLVRMEDVDQPRSQPGAADAILRTLEACGFEWDGAVLAQSTRSARYAEAMGTLIAAGHAYACACTRKEIADSIVRAGRGVSLGEMPYPGTCRDGVPAGRIGRAWRVRVDDAPVRFVDRVQGTIEQRLASEVGDFVVKRADGWFAYQLAVVVDDADQHITSVVRGADLLDSTARQIHLQRLLGLPTPAYLHVPVAANAAGEKLSKQTRARPIAPATAAAALVAAFDFLGQAPPPELARARPHDVLAWAIAQWRPAAIAATRALPSPLD